MDMSLSNCFYANETLAASPNYSDIVYKRGPSSPWVVTGTSNASLAAFSATCFFTALHLKQNVPAMKDVPIGLVQSSVGGTTIESWLSADALAAAGIENAACGVRGCGNQSYCGNYDALIAPLAPTVFKHMAWYQVRFAQRARARALSTPMRSPPTFALPRRASPTRTATLRTRRAATTRGSSPRSSPAGARSSTRPSPRSS